LVANQRNCRFLGASERRGDFLARRSRSAGRINVYDNGVDPVIFFRIRDFLRQFFGRGDAGERVPVVRGIERSLQVKMGDGARGRIIVTRAVRFFLPRSKR